MANPTPPTPASGGENEPQPTTQSQTASPPRRKRRRRTLLIVLAAVPVLIALLPILLSATGIARGIALGQIKPRIAGKVEIDRLKLRWFGSCVADGVRLYDLAGREVLSVEKVDTGQGLLSMLLSGGDMEKVYAKSVQAVAYVTQDNTVSLATAVSPPDTSGRDHLVPAELLKDVLEVQAPAVQASWVDSQLQLRAADHVTALRRADSARGIAAGAVLQISKLEVHGAAGTYKLTLEADGHLDTLADVGLGWKGADGTVNLSADGDVGAGGTRIAFRINLDNARYPQSPAESVEPINANITGQVALAAGKISGSVALDGNLGSARAEVQYNPPARPAPLQLNHLMSAVLTGVAVKLPDVTLKSSARLDVAMIAPSRASALRVHPGLTFTSGELHIDNLELTGGNAASIKGGVEITSISADNAGKNIELTPLTATIDAFLKPGHGLEFRQAQLKSSYAQIDAQGSAARLQVRYQADLTEMKQQLAQLFDLKLSDLGGKVSGELAVTRADENHTEVALALNAAQFIAGAGEKRLQLDRGSISGEGAVTLKEGQVARITAGHTQLNVDGKIVGGASGWYDFVSQGFDAQVEFERIEVPHVASKLVVLGLEGSEAYAGVLELKANASRPTGDAAITSDGGLRGTDVSREGQLLFGKEITLRWTKASFEPKSQRAAAEKIEVVSRDLSADLKVAYAPSSNPLDLGAQRLAAATLTGETSPLPDISVEGGIKASLTALTRAVPQLLATMPDAKITAGTLQISGLQLVGGSSPALRGTTTLSGLAVQQGERTLAWEPMHADLDITLQPGKGLTCARADLDFGFAKLNGSGTPADFKLDFQTDLAKAKKQLGTFVELPAGEFQGQSTGRLTLTRTSDDRTNVALTANLEQAQFATGERRLGFEKASLNHSGFLTTRDGQLHRITTDAFKADVDGQIAVSGSGWYDLPSGAFNAMLSVPLVDLAFAGGLASAWGLPELKRYAGAAMLNVDAKRSAGDGVIVSNGSLTANKVLIDKQEIVPDEKSEITLKWSDLQFEPKSRDFRAKLVQLDSAFAQLSARDTSLKLRGQPTATGRITCNAALTGALHAVGRAARWETIPAIAGQLSFDSRCETTGGVVSVQGSGKIVDLIVGVGNKSVKEKHATFDYEASLDGPQELLNLKQLKLESQGLSAEASGRISELKSRRVLAIGGSYDASWERVTTLLHEIVPSSVEMVALAGQKRSEFELSGPLAGEGEQLVSSQLSGHAGLGWTSAKIAGLLLGPAEFKSTLGESRVDIPLTRIDASGGTVMVGGAIELHAKEPILRIPGEVQLIDKVAIDPAIAQSLLSRVNPIFVNMTSVEGLVSVRTQDLVLPFGEALKTASQGHGYLDLTNLKVQPSGLLAELLQLAGPRESDKPSDKASEKEPIQVSGVDFEIKAGRFVYQNFTMTFAEDFDLRFYGSVGFDDTVDLVVSVPVRQELLDRLKVGGDVGKALGLLSAARVDIPIVGTRTKPKLDLSAIDITKLLTPDVGLIPKLGEILGGERSGDAGQDQPPPQEPQKRKSPKRRPGR